MRYTCSIWLGYERVYMYLVKDKEQNHKCLNDKYLSIYIHEKNDYVCIERLENQKLSIDYFEHIVCLLLINIFTTVRLYFIYDLP